MFIYFCQLFKLFSTQHNHLVAFIQIVLYFYFILIIISNKFLIVYILLFVIHLII